MLLFEGLELKTPLLFWILKNFFGLDPLAITPYPYNKALKSELYVSQFNYDLLKWISCNLPLKTLNLF